MQVQFGRCPCGGEYTTKEVEVRIAAAGVELSGVAQGVCHVCGGRVYKLDTLQRIEAVMRGQGTDPVIGGHG